VVSIDGFLIDATVTEGHSFDSEVTAYPVESGADIADNIRAKPLRITLDCVVSDTPLAPAIVNARRGQGLPSAEIYNRLLVMRDKREPVTVVTTLAVFKNMALETLSIPRNATDGHSLRFSVTFVQVKIVSNLHAVVVVDEPRHKAKSNRGHKASPEPNPAAETPIPAPPERATSVLFDLRERFL